MKKLINNPDDVLADALVGLAAAEPLLNVDKKNRIVYRATPKDQGKVALISGGGSGHEPMHGGLVGLGMLDAACAGAVFTSPTPDPVVAATQAVNAGAGVVHIVKNYTGDVMNFQIAAELAADEGITVETVLVDDDVAVEDSLYTAGRRGTGAAVLVEKIAGACAEAGGSLDDVVTLGRRVAALGRSFGVALTSGTTPAAGRRTFRTRRNHGNRRRGGVFAGLEVLVGLDPGHAVPVGAGQHVGGAHGFHFLRTHRVHDRRGHACTDHHGDEAGVDAVAMRQAEGDVGQAAGGVDLEFLAQAAQ